MNIKHPTLLKDSLYNCSKDCTTNKIPFDGIRKLTPCQVYGQGIVVGMVSAFMAQNMTFMQALTLVTAHMPSTFDENCLPPSWRSKKQ